MNEDLSILLSAGLSKQGINGSIENLEPLTGGASKETWKFNLVNSSKSSRMIFRRGSGAESSLAIRTSDEAKIQEEVLKKGVPVPEIVLVSNSNNDLGNSYVMKFIEGETIARKILRDECYKSALPLLAHQCGEAIAKIHNTPLKNLQFLPKKSPIQLIEDLYLLYESYKQPSPVFEYAYRWLKEQNYGNFEDSLVHGDFRLGNILVNENGLTGIIDWELAHIGNPIQDLGWMCGNSWRFGNSKKVVGGFGDIEDLIKGYNGISNEKINAELIKTWQVFGTFRWGVICLMQAYAHLNGSVNSIEKAAIGRRVSETEIDIVDLLLLGGD
jgi:aminoglycoside phosphotransferase (APT) family kinase protein